ncbi:2-phosphosulfolactate phosphatase [Paenibacillus oenotherae]|uniref:Probable 2-phosphosulfolactate phosphatase n=1 Tax=Paenibacillus oenotherae TaxID=1435645 RepID=A0ABS7D0Z4_9BACL|nr:2-phosphosulfolactate phosphatase [Paenibacillus oenotherae]MBW7473564.1 2-phosphosulfolactate phosphatase [Paenibacillus oenotherae]
MHIEVISSVNEARADRFTHRTAIVIDVLRATSTMITALQAGAVSIYPVETVLEARTLQRQGYMLAGERFCRKIPGFELGNSPNDFTPEVVQGRRIVLTTTNGTRAVHKAMRADFVLSAALLNATACAKAAIELRRDVVLLCAGCHDDFALEDGLCAGLIIDRLKALSSSSVGIDDFGTAMLGLYHSSKECVAERLTASSSGKRLIKMGFGRDIESCAQLDTSGIVPKLQGDMIIVG